MPYWLASERRKQASDFVTRFDPRFWTVNFPRPAMAAATTPAPDALRVDAVFQREGDLVGVIWEAVDRFDHPLLAYETSPDFRGCVLSFRWRSAGVAALDEVDGAVLTVEGREADGEAFTAYVRLWNYAVGTGEDERGDVPRMSRVAGGQEMPGGDGRAARDRAGRCRRRSEEKGHERDRALGAAAADGGAGAEGDDA